jgi:hypothetical protein
MWPYVQFRDWVVSVDPSDSWRCSAVLPCGMSILVILYWHVEIYKELFVN